MGCKNPFKIEIMIQNIKNFAIAVLFIAAMSGFAALVIETFN